MSLTVFALLLLPNVAFAPCFRVLIRPDNTSGLRGLVVCRSGLRPVTFRGVLRDMSVFDVYALEIWFTYPVVAFLTAALVQILWLLKT